MDEDRKYAEQYPLMDKKIWEYNPLNPQQLKDYDVSSYCYRHSRRDWKVSAYDKGYGINYDGDSRKPEYLIDGERRLIGVLVRLMTNLWSCLIISF